MNNFLTVLTLPIIAIGLSSCGDSGEKPEPKAKPAPPVEAPKPEEAAAPPERPDRSAMAQQMIERWDVDADDAVSDYEVDERMWQFIARADSNADGKVTAEEFTNMPLPEGGGGTGDGKGKGGFGGFGGKGKGTPRPEPAELVAQVDKNGDGLIQEDESPEMWRWISAADTNGDGGVSAEEMIARRAARDAERAAGGGDAGFGGFGRGDRGDRGGRGGGEGVTNPPGGNP